MKTTAFKSALVAFSGGAVLALAAPAALADTAEANQKANEMALKYAMRGFTIRKVEDGRAGFGVTYKFDIPVNRGGEYLAILAGDRNALGVELWVEDPDTGGVIIKDTRRLENGVAGVNWRSDFSGKANVIIHFARVVNHCAWSSLIGSRGTTPTRPAAPVSTPVAPPAKPAHWSASRLVGL